MRSGGIAGVTLRRSLDTASLPPDGRRAVDEALAACDLDALAGRATGPASGADRFRYALTIDAGDRRRDIALAEPDVPDALRPVLEIVISEGRRTG